MSADSELASNSSAASISPKPPCMFTVEHFQLAASSQDSNNEPTQVYIVRPIAIWDSLKRFKQCQIEGKSDCYRLHDTITIFRHEQPQPHVWTAHILEIRGHQPSGQVFIRLYWLYKPSQLPPSLRHSFHGREELLGSNSMAVIDASTVLSRTPVSHWNEESESVPAPGLFWRQKYDVLTQTLSNLHTPCPPPCIEHQNPDDTLFHCPGPDCHARMHKPCVLSATLDRAQTNMEARAEAEIVSNRKSKKKKAAPRKQLTSLSAEWVDSGGSDGVRITESPGGHYWEEDVHCLSCGTLLR